ncbi:MAG: GTPase Era [Bifidobacteriaceae bacterium]|jgi:GTP-binding protein Era|nr:GTPase Era [Bifidobacteriaceae bacterium]
MTTIAKDHRSGFVALVGRPNSGKSTLTNAMVGTKVAITSSRPQTTRRTIRGIVRRREFQLVLVDTPGLHKPRTLLGERLGTMVRQELDEVDAIVMCLPADQQIGTGDRFIADHLPSRIPLIAAVTKADLVGRGAMVQALAAVAEMDRFVDIVPVSAVNGYQVEDLVGLLGARMPLGPDLYPDGEVSDQPVDLMVAELVREAALEDLRDELPHSLAVMVDEIVPREEPHQGVAVRVTVYVERDSQKGIVIGHGGSRLKEVGTVARREIEALLGERVYLDLHVKVARDWQSDPKHLARLGF